MNDLKCIKCEILLLDGLEDGYFCDKCNNLYYDCDKCNNWCDFIGVIGDEDSFENEGLIKLNLDEIDTESCPLYLKEGMKYFKNPNSTKYYISSGTLDDCCAYKWYCQKCNKYFWSHPD